MKKSFVQDILVCTMATYTSENTLNYQDKTSLTFDFFLFTLVIRYKNYIEKYITIK